MAKAKTIQTLTPNRLRFASRWLAKRDSALKRVLDEHGYPQLWDRPPGFSMTVDLVRCAMTKHTGIGDWTADLYLSECLLRCDILPKGDIGVQEAFRVLKGLDARPAHEKLEAMTKHWCPWRSVGTRMLWLFYLNRRKANC